MHAIAPASGPPTLSTTEIRRRVETDDSSPNRAPPPPANDQGLGGRPILPAAAAFDPSKLGEDAPSAVLKQEDEANAIQAMRRAEDDSRKRDAAPPPETDEKAIQEPPQARLEVVNLQGRLGAPVAAYDNSRSPPTLVIYV